MIPKPILTVSKTSRNITIKKQTATIHHLLKNEHAMLYWFSIFTDRSGFMFFDIREWWKHIGVEEPDNWIKMSPKEKLDMTTEISRDAIKNGHNLIIFAGKSNDQPH